MKRMTRLIVPLCAVLVSLAPRGARGDAPPPPPTALLTVTPSAWDFGSVNVGASPEKILTVSNDGSVTLALGRIAVPGPFSVASDTCSDNILVPYDSCTLTARFIPPAAGGYAADLEVPYSDPDLQPHTAIVSLSGTGVVVPVPSPDISLDRGTINFGVATVGAAVTTAAIVNNTGDADLRIGGISLSGAAASEFAQTNDCASPLPPLGSCAVTVRFSPAAPGDKIASLSIASNDPDENPLTVTVTGTGVAPASTPSTGPNVPGGSGDSAGGGGCFIATAAYGSSLEPHVMSLRTFRDERLLTNPAGRALVAFYYRTSPPIAAVIAKHGSLRLVARLLLAPVVFGVRYPVPAILFAVAPVGVWALRKKRRRKRISAS